MTLGGEGRGPGEIDGGGRVAVVGEHVVHVGQGRLSVWDRQGTLLAAPAYAESSGGDGAESPGGTGAESPD